MSARTSSRSGWASKIQGLADHAEVTQALFNNCYSDYVHRDARQLETLVSS